MRSLKGSGIFWCPSATVEKAARVNANSVSKNAHCAMSSPMAVSCSLVRQRSTGPGIMPNKVHEKQLTEAEIAQRRDEVVKRMLSTPPRPHKGEPKRRKVTEGKPNK